MKTIIMLFMLIQSGPKPTPTPKPEWTPQDTGSTSLITTSTWYPSTITTPMMVIHLQGETILEINGADGKKLKLSADGKVTGDLPHDQAADNFWKAVATFAPHCAQPTPKGEKE